MIFRRLWQFIKPDMPGPAKPNCNPIDLVRVTARELLDGVKDAYDQAVETGRFDRVEELRALVAWVVIVLKDTTATP